MILKTREKYLERADELLSYVEGNWEHSTDIQDEELVEWLIAEAKNNYIANIDFKNTLKDLLAIWKSNKRYSDNTHQHEYCNGWCDAIERILIMLDEKSSTSTFKNDIEINF